MFDRIGLPELVVLLVLAVGLALYVLPTIVAAVRKKRKLPAILLLNLLLGWSVVGWIVALVWAISRDARDASSGAPAEGG